MSTGKRAGLWLMAFLYVLAGAMHFVRPEVYLPMMPPWLPAHRELVLLSGAAEILLGLLLLPAATRRLAAWGVILLLVAVFPANLHVALHDVPLFGAEKGAGALNWVRLPFQLLLAWWAWAYARPEADSNR
ncbi:DoxX family protein [bacterium]|nr:DoxX family protein [bacterium]